MVNTVVVEDDNVPEVTHFRIGSSPTAEAISTDPFNTPASEAKALDGLTPVFKRRVTNELKKVADGSGSKQITVADVTAYNAFDVVQPPYNLDYLAKVYEISGPHKAAVDAKTANIVGLGWKFVESEKTKRTLEDIDNADRLKRVRKQLQRAKSDLTEIFDNLNPDDTFTEVLMKVWVDYETLGNGYIEIGRKKDGSIGYVGHIDAKSVRVRQPGDGFVQMVSNKAVFFRKFGDKKTSNPFGNDNNPNEIIHIKKYSPAAGGYYGVPDIIAAQSAIAGNEFASRFNLDYFENKAVPRHVIILKGATLATTTENALLQFFETGLKGQNHRTLYIPLPGDSGDKKVDLKIEPIEAGIQDASFDKYKKSNLNEILMVHRVPISKVGLAEGVSLAVARDADKTFKEQVCGPMQKIFEKKISKIVKEFTDAFDLKLNEMTLTDEDTQSKIWERAIKNQWTTPNEVRAEQGKAGLKGGDKVVEQKPQQQAENRAQGTRARDAARSAGATDSAGEARNPQGEGRTTP